MKRIRLSLAGISMAVSMLIVASIPLYAATLPATPPANPPAGSSFEQRLIQRKAERAIKLDVKDQKRIGERCVNVQGKIRGLYQADTSNIDNRNKSYQTVDAKLWVTIGRLKLSSQDTFQLEKQRSKFVVMLNDFQTTGANYTQTLDDIQVINCKADVVGFQALLETARLYYKQVVSKSNAVDNYVVNDIKSTLASHVSDLQPKSEAN